MYKTETDTERIIRSIQTQPQRIQDRVNDLLERRRKNIMMNKTGSKTTKHVELPTYKMKRGKVMEAHSNLHLNKDGKRVITTKVKILHGLTSKEKESLKQSILIALS